MPQSKGGCGACLPLQDRLVDSGTGDVRGLGGRAFALAYGFNALGAGIAAVLGPGRSAFIYYETSAGRDEISEHSIAGGLRFEF